MKTLWSSQAYPQSTPATKILERGMGWLTLSAILVGGLNYGYSLCLTWLLPATSYAQFAGGQALLLICGVVAGASISWFVAQGIVRAEDDAEARRRVLCFALLLAATLGPVVALVAAATAAGFASISEQLALAVTATALFFSAIVVGFLQGCQLEGRWSRLVYGRRPMAVVSPSTRAAVRSTLGLRGPVFIVPNGAPSPVQLGSRRRSPTPLIGCVGRLAAHKRMDLLVRAALKLRERVPGVAIEIAGDGPDRPRLEKLAKDLGVDDVVRFLGHVSPEAKERLLESAWLTVNPSMGEGWGLGVLEANAHGVPAVAFRVPGLHDSVRDGITGWLVGPDEDLSARIARALAALSEPHAADAWARRCRAWAARFDWDESARRLAGIIVAERARRARWRSDRRTTSSAACLVELAVPPHRRLEDVVGGLRRTDLVSVQGDRARMVLHAVDARDVGVVLDRLNLAAVAITTASATGYDLLVGPSLDPDIAAPADLAPTGTLAAP